MKKSSFILNPNSERYRICKEITCLKAFMTDHLGREFCCDKCKIEFNNRKIRMAALIKKQEKTMELTKQVKWIQSNKACINLLDTLSIPESGLLFNPRHLEEAGFIFDAYNERIRAEGAMSSFNLLYGPYLLSFEAPDQVLIIKIK